MEPPCSGPATPSGVGIAEGGCDVPATEIDRALLFDGADRSEGIIGEYLKITRSHVWLLSRKPSMNTQKGMASYQEGFEETHLITDHRKLRLREPVL